MKQHFWKSSLSLGLSFLVFSVGLPVAAVAQDPPARIDIIVVEGEDVTTLARQRVSRDPVVRVEDDDHRPIAGASVVFALPVSGTSGEFANGSRTLIVVTDSGGLATAQGLRANDVPGKLQIYVTASYRGVRARALINQMVQSSPRAKPATPAMQTSRTSGRWKWVVLGIAGAAGAGAGVYFGTHTSTPSPVSISASTVVFGSPR
jgi:hypothetical protein